MLSELLEKFWRRIGESGFIEKASFREYSRGEALFHQGDLCRDLFVLKSGLVKLHYTTLEGKEWIKSFILEGGLIGSLQCQLRHQPSSFSVTFLEDSLCYRLSYDDFRQYCEQNPELLILITQLFEELALKKELRERDFLCLSAEERYRKFIQENPDLAKRITQMDMARYLGMTYVALSRIKHRNAA